MITLEYSQIGITPRMSPATKHVQKSLQTLLSMRSPWVGSLALLAPAHGFVAQPAVGRGGASMLQTFVRPQAAGLRTAVSSQGWRHEGLRLQRAAPRAVSAAAGTRMMAGGGGDGARAKKEKVKKPESYYKKTVILPQTAFEQVRFAVVLWAYDDAALSALPPSHVSMIM